MKKKRKIIRGILMVFFLSVFAVSAWQLYNIGREYDAGDDTYSDLEQYVSFEETVPVTDVPETSESQEETSETTETVPDDTLWPEIDFAALEQINPDIVGWLYIEGTPINYPVVQGADNDYYLNHLFDGRYNSAGCLFLDAYNVPDFSGENSIIYGHHMKNGSMFHDLRNYRKQEFYDDHPMGLLITPAQRYKIQFFSGYVSDTSSGAWNMAFTDGEYEQWLTELAAKSCFDSPVIPTAENQVITLSTCSYEFDDARFVLHGILVPAGTPE